MAYQDVSVELTYNAGQKDSFTILVEGEYYASTVERHMMGVNAKSKDE